MKNFTKQIFKIALICSLFFIKFSAHAQAPQKMSYQAVIRNASNTLIVNTAVGVKISVLQTSASGTVVYSERHTPTTNANGLATFEIGGGTILTGTFAGINWANGPYFIKTETDTAGGTNYTISGTSQLASVPYALFAANGGTATNAWGLNGTAGTTATNFIGTTDNTALKVKTNNEQAMIIEPNGYTVLGSGVIGPIIDRFGIEGNALMIGTSNTLDDGTLKLRNRGFLFQEAEDRQMNLDGATLQTTKIDQQGSYASDLKLNPFGGNIGIGNTGILQNKLQIGNPPGFVGNDIAIGNGTQAMSLFQSPTASTFFTNTNFAFMPAGGPANVGIGTTTPTSKLEVNGSVASKFTLITSDYTPTDNDYIIYVNRQFETTTNLNVTLPLPASCVGRIYHIKAIALPEIVSNVGIFTYTYDVDGPFSDVGSIVLNPVGGATIKNHLGQVMTYLHSKYDTANTISTSRTSVCVQSIGLRWIILSSDFLFGK